MKTAEEWANEMDKECDKIGGWETIDQIEAWIKQIQLDALKEGARRAAKTVINTMATGSPYQNRLVMESAILAAAEQWTEKDL